MYCTGLPCEPSAVWYLVVVPFFARLNTGTPSGKAASTHASSSWLACWRPTAVWYHKCLRSATITPKLGRLFPPADFLHFLQVCPGDDPEQFEAAAATVQYKVDHGGKR